MECLIKHIKNKIERMFIILSILFCMISTVVPLSANSISYEQSHHSYRVIYDNFIAQEDTLTIVIMVSISYENIENYFQVIVFMLQNAKLPNYDDKTKTLHLNKLNAAVLSKVDKNEVLTNNEYFSKFQVKDEFERKLLKSAKKLRLSLRHFNELQIT